MKVVAGKSVLVTGAGHGLGRAYALDLARHGARVVVNDVDGGAARSVAAEVDAAGGVAVAHPGSVADWEEAGRMVDAAVRRFGRLDGLVNNAGLFHLAEPWEEEGAAARAMVEVNVLGTLYCGLHAIRHMVANGGGSIVNDTSGAHLGMRRRGTYGATKGATASLAYSWALDLAPAGVRVNAVSPIARTAMVEYGVSRGEGGTEVAPEHVAPLVTYLLSDAASAVTGRLLRIDGAELSLLSPPGARRWRCRRDHWDVEELAREVPALLAAAAGEVRSP